MLGSEFRGCQLANTWTGWPEGYDVVHVEPKLDGYRLSAIIREDGSVAFFCREPEPPKWIEHLGHIAAEIQELGLEPGHMLDGEVMAADWNETSKLLRTYREGMLEYTKAIIRREVKFFVFDLIRMGEVRPVAPVGRQRKWRHVYDVPQAERRAHLLAVLGEDREKGWSVQALPSFECTTPEGVMSTFVAMCKDFEGAIVKLPDAPYKLDDRNDGWLKIKPTETRELTIEKVVEGNGEMQGMAGAIQGTDDAGVYVSVGSGISKALRAKLWAERDLLIGQRLEFKHQTGKVAAARHPVFIRIRDLG
jgi:ATP-dependent DNA ligase